MWQLTRGTTEQQPVAEGLQDIPKSRKLLCSGKPLLMPLQARVRYQMAFVGHYAIDNGKHDIIGTVWFPDCIAFPDFSPSSQRSNGIWRDTFISTVSPAFLSSLPAIYTLLCLTATGAWIDSSYSSDVPAPLWIDDVTSLWRQYVFTLDVLISADFFIFTVMLSH